MDCCSKEWYGIDNVCELVIGSRGNSCVDERGDENARRGGILDEFVGSVRAMVKLEWNGSRHVGELRAVKLERFKTLSVAAKVLNVLDVWGPEVDDDGRAPGVGRSGIENAIGNCCGEGRMGFRKEAGIEIRHEIL